MCNENWWLDVYECHTSDKEQQLIEQHATASDALKFRVCCTSDHKASTWDVRMYWLKTYNPLEVSKKDFNCCEAESNFKVVIFFIFLAF